ncbi:recombinase zinc beta ribbon domain-containing protein [Sinorhizobium meliloti]|uniref:recombinase zinc beta ribbon domain-containing protein n=1 Tax=Rhizobium meliloti TaxID=382 RepID=UPI000FD85AFA|nr:recombinase zinc beta ribbon domain-containing protein [Sinorhizobium meliloti]MCO6426418.1 recombinase family protein [Sinorhizobium meliloti]RVL25490.1 hypothetical protein CN148_33865 [Sinorhizobium meliloti]
MHFPRPSDGRKLTALDWTPIRYRNVISVLKNPFYAGAYAYGKSKSRTAVVDGRAHKTYGHIRPLDEYDVLLKDHHEGYIDWGIYERNQKQLAIDAYGQRDGAKSGRGGRSLLIGLMTCGQCGHRLRVAYRGRYPYPVYQCIGRTAHGLPRCMCFGGQRVDTAIARELMRVVQPIAIQAARDCQEFCAVGHDDEKERIITWLSRKNF